MKTAIVVLIFALLIAVLFGEAFTRWVSDSWENLW